MCTDSCVYNRYSYSGNGVPTLNQSATLDEFLDLLCKNADSMTEEDWDRYHDLWAKIKLEGLITDP